MAAGKTRTHAQITQSVLTTSLLLVTIRARASRATRCRRMVVRRVAPTRTHAQMYFVAWRQYALTCWHHSKLQLFLGQSSVVPARQAISVNQDKMLPRIASHVHPAVTVSTLRCIAREHKIHSVPPARQSRMQPSALPTSAHLPTTHALIMQPVTPSALRDSSQYATLPLE